MVLVWRKAALASIALAILATACGLDTSGTESLDEGGDAGADSPIEDATLDTAQGSSDGGGDASDASTADATDASTADASDATTADASDASTADATDASTADASDATTADASDASTADASDATIEDASDASVTDANDAAAPDANDGSIQDAGPTNFCSKHSATFCVDFDENDALAPAFCSGAPDGSFCTVTATGDASVALDQTASFSAPGSMLSTVPAFGSGLVQAYGARALPPHIAPLHIAIEARVDSFGAGSAFPLYVILGDFVLGGSGGHGIGVLALAEDGGATYSLFIQESVPGSAPAPVLVATGLAAGTWHHLVLTVDDVPDASDGGASLLVDEEDASVAIRLEGVTQDASTRIATVGAPIVLGPAGAWSIQVDNVIAVQE